MNHINNKFFVFIAVLGMVTLSLMSCKKDKKDPGPEISAEEKAQLELLLGTWNLTDVTQDDEPVQEGAGDYTGLSLAINASLEDGSGKTYSVTGGDYVFPDVSEASWSFVEGSNFEVIEREDGELMRIVTLAEGSLVLRQEVTVNHLAEGRVATVGIYLFTFSK